MSRHLHANEAPGAHPPSWYAATAHPAPNRPALEGEISVDVAVIGGGYAGLCAALTAAEAGKSVAVLEAHRAGWGASGRNGGQLASLPRRDLGFYESAMGREDAKRIAEIARDANTYVRELIQRFDIACDLRDGILEVHHRARHDAAAPGEVTELQRDYGVDWLEAMTAPQVAEILPAKGYFGGVMDWKAAHLHPLNLAIGLAQAAEKAGAVIYELSEVVELQLDPPALKTARGTVRADSLVIAANGYHDGLSPRVANRVMPINNFILATEPLGARAEEVLRRDIAVADSRFVVNYFRMSPDKRLLFGGGESQKPRFPADQAGLVRKAMLQVYPHLHDVRIDYAWGGVLGITISRAPLFARLGPRALSIGGWSGSGIHMAALGGRIAVEALLGEESRFATLSRAPTPVFPGGQTFREPLLMLALSWYRLRDWL